MGLDVYPAGRAKPGHEIEWRKRIQVLYDGVEETRDQADQRFAVSIQPWEDAGAPRVGYDPAADAWALTEPNRDKSKSDAEVLKEMHGFYALELLRGKCNGISRYTHAGFYDLDETSFRGSFLECCEDLLGEELLETAWADCMRPEEAIEYGEKLLAVADRAARRRIGLPSVERASPQAPGVEAEAGLKRYGMIEVARASAEDAGSDASGGNDDGIPEVTLDEKIDILRSAGRWYVFWGKRGHPIVAWF